MPVVLLVGFGEIKFAIEPEGGGCGAGFGAAGKGANAAGQFPAVGENLDASSFDARGGFAADEQARAAELDHVGAVFEPVMDVGEAVGQRGFVGEFEVDSFEDGYGEGAYLEEAAALVIRAGLVKSDLSREAPWRTGVNRDDGVAHGVALLEEVVEGLRANVQEPETREQGAAHKPNARESQHASH